VPRRGATATRSPRTAPSSTSQLLPDHTASVADRLLLLPAGRPWRMPVRVCAMSAGPDGASGALILLRHGESTWNKGRLFTGWGDPPLTEQGAAEARAAGLALARARLWPDLVVTSVLCRAIDTVDAVTEAMRVTVPVLRDWRLNERHYGALEGCSHDQARRRYGDTVVDRWRRSWTGRPPPLPAEDPRSPVRDPRYAGLPAEQLPVGESLADALERQLRFLPRLELPSVVTTGQRVLLVGHGNSLRALVAHLERIPPSQVPHLLIPTGEPRVYGFHGRWLRRRVSFGVRGTRHGP
jgi:2,3-bisphosphoglycerate-dependent phosphoglycerate mutase